jgi:hypothetical protein
MDATVQPVARSTGKRRYRRSDEKRRIVEETLAPEASLAVIARRHGVNANQVFHWRKLYQAGLLGTSGGMTATFPIGSGSAWRDCCWMMWPYKKRKGYCSGTVQGGALSDLAGRNAPS